MIDLAKSRLSVWPAVLIVACLVSFECAEANAQGGFKRSSGSPYSDGQAKQATPGVSKFEPSTNRNATPTFGRGGTSTLTPPRTSIQQSDPGTGSQIGDTSGMGEGRVSACTIEYVDEIDVPALETGALVEMNVTEGDAVPTGTVIARINDTLLKHQLRQALVRKNNAYRIANDTTSMEAAEKQIQLTRQRYETTSKLERKGARSSDEKLTARYEYEVAQLQLRAANMRQLEAQGEAELENARAREVEERIQRHAVVATFDGVVVDRYKQQSEWVTAGEPVVRIARMDKLYVTGLISNRDYNPSDVKGKDVLVTVELARKEKMEFPGKIVIIGSKDIAGTGNEFMVKAEITNKMKQGQWVLRKDARVSMRIMLK
ncbi:efflux RND transporter periplasmic adaptor subunit [Mariniblastus fucicola]|uniref:efflux RND transporter periplasmic adaptor subunit n=1 Tax=Mariniblastus fucicola TaxID=980251 RepID=UPI00138FB172|nr:HlyD family efflux transporter periplasmic adaptor subunit [Mariniblastus fucicola]